MQQLRSVWSGLSQQKRIVALLAAVAMFAAVLGLARLASQPGMSLLYAGLEDGAAGDVVAALEQRGVAYEVRGSSIFVDSVARDELRLTLAAEGLPENGTDGYELLDTLSGFGTTSQMFDAAYWRAKEGELARTIVSSPAIRTARVHIANPGTKPFQRDLTPSASVTVGTASGGLSAAQARGLRFLVASAVSGLDPENVSVIDSSGGIILASDAEAEAGARAEDRATELKRNVERLLEARVGYGNAVVEVSVDTATETEQITERRFDPESRVPISQETTESTSTSSGEGGAGVTVASNLPNGDAGAGAATSTSQSAETSERINYEVSEVSREVLRTPGAVRRLSVAVLVDGIRTTGPDGEAVWQPRSDEEMQALRALVSSAVGLDEERGDSLTLRSLEFEPLPTDGTEPGALGRSLPIDAMRLAQLAILGLVTLLIGLFVVRPILTTRSGAAASPMPMALPDPGPLDGGFEAGFPQMALPMASFDQAQASTPASDSGDPVERLRALIDERQAESLEILKSWMEEEEKA
ncbi:flagellar M-ring protein FliF [Tranquillimonas rosea]|uniref:Flagellar M-ring protein n=1 Tax=Tranquillimonas rosea TaxID=641238 RepID=A0A1H9UD26_9RHOB|nr:flagellar basal-body MS-ring/collar protein FliF [Tranquillimonas rosea]SES06973.1 flagellar M-ring protein FliF [Tranquillimonas rosea]